MWAFSWCPVSMYLFLLDSISFHYAHIGGSFFLYLCGRPGTLFEIGAAHSMWISLVFINNIHQVCCAHYLLSIFFKPLNWGLTDIKCCADLMQTTWSIWREASSYETISTICAINISLTFWSFLLIVTTLLQGKWCHCQFKKKEAELETLRKVPKITQLQSMVQTLTLQAKMFTSIRSSFCMYPTGTSWAQYWGQGLFR